MGLFGDIPALIYAGDCLEQIKKIPAASVDAVITDPPYPEIDRPYGRMTEADWHKMMDGLVTECRRVLRPTGSAVFILQPNSERVGRMRPWLWEFMAKWTREWGMVQDVWWWSINAPPTVHCQRAIGLLRPSVKACVWLGDFNCYRNQGSILWKHTYSQQAMKREGRGVTPSGHSMDRQRMIHASVERGGSSPFNLIPLSPAGEDQGGKGHVASTPIKLCLWWVKYICPPGGMVLDPFMGSGTVGIAATRRACRVIGIERDPEYFKLAVDRINGARKRFGMKTKVTVG